MSGAVYMSARWNLFLSTGESLVLMPLQPPDGDADDAALARRTAAGDEPAFTTLFRRYKGPVYRFVRQMGAAPDEADDVTQDVFVTFMETAARFDPALGSLRVYLYGIARNLLRRRFRRRLAHPEVELDDAAGPPNPSYATASRTRDPLAEVERLDSLRRLRRAIAELPAHYREVIVLCDLHELRYEEAALVVHCPVGTIRSRLSRARRVLAGRCLREAGDPASDARYPRRCLA
jgi:RNA polymerase sigma-70 factor (ECF subfamily)